jgi:acetyltransferase-like isoleucine patch superfamily enzyme
MSSARIMRRLAAAHAYARCWLFLRSRVTGRLKLRGDVGRIRVHPSFRCDGDLWLGVHAEGAFIEIGAGVSASGPLVITAVRGLRINPGVLFGPNVLVTDHYHGDLRDRAQMDLTPSRRPLYSPGEIVIGNDVQLGANSVVLSPARLGSGAVVAANAVVKGQILERTVYKGLASPRQHGQRRDGAPGD